MWWEYVEVGFIVLLALFASALAGVASATARHRGWIFNLLTGIGSKWEYTIGVLVKAVVIGSVAGSFSCWTLFGNRPSEITLWIFIGVGVVLSTSVSFLFYKF